MSTLRIPSSEKQIIQANKGDYIGNVFNSYNIDLDSNPGTIKVSRKLTRVLDDTQWGTDDIMQALQIHDGFYYVATTRAVFRCSVSDNPTVDTNWTDISTLGNEDLGLETDMASFNGLLLISLGTDIMSWTGAVKDSAWWDTTTLGTVLTANFVHTMEVLRSGTDTLFVTNNNQVRYYNVPAGHTTITLDTLMTANCLTSSLDRMWVGTYTEVENNAFVYELRVGDTQALQAYEVDGRVCLTAFTYGNTPFVITERGYIQGFDGAGFKTVAQFPWASGSTVMEGCRPGQVQTPATSKAIHPKGAKVKGNYCYIYVNTEDEYSETNLTPRAASGVWVLDLETYSLTHRYALNEDVSTYGTHKVNRSGPVLITNTPETRIMVGGSINNTEGIWMESNAVNQGYFTTVRHESDSVDDTFEKVIIKADKLDATESITVKHKDISFSNLPLEVLAVTWLSANQFNTLATLTNVAIGDEVEICAGFAAGQICHITDITGTITKTVTVDASIGVLNNLSDVYLTSYKKIDNVYTSDDGEVKKIGAGEVSPSRQYKVVMQGDVTLREIISKSNVKHEV